LGSGEGGKEEGKKLICKGRENFRKREIKERVVGSPDSTGNRKIRYGSRKKKSTVK